MKKSNRAVSTLVNAVASMSLIALSVQSAVAADEKGLVEVDDRSKDFSNVLNHRLADAKQALVVNNRYIITLSDVEGVASSTESVSKVPGGPVMTLDNAGAVLSALGAKLEVKLSQQNMVAATIVSKKMLQDVRSMPGVASVDADPRRYLMAQTTPYGINMVQAPQLPQSNTSARKVCVVDTGYDYGHDDLPEGSVTGDANNSQVGNWWQDGNGHGTHVAGTIAALDNNDGVVGVYPGVDLHIVKIFNDSGNWTFASDLIAGINQCQSAGSDVVNMSLGGGSSSNAENNAMQGFVNDGIMLVAAAGNDGNSSRSYPASYDAVISVAAVNSSQNHASYSQYNPPVEIAAPGSSVSSTYPVNSYATLSGTSMATPHVAGGAALVWSYFTQCSNQQIRAALNATAKDRGASGRDNFYGYGILQVEDAYDYLDQYGCSGNSGGNNGGGSGNVEPVSGQISNLSGSRGSWKRYTWDIPQGVTTMQVRISGGSGDADLYLNYDRQPLTNRYDCRPYNVGNNEVCTITNPQSGTWHVGIRAYSAFSGVTMNYAYE